MENNKISFGKRPSDPLRKRVWKDMLRDWKRYLMICLMLIVTIGFVSGLYVANNSILNSMKNGVVDMKRENGHFQLSKMADEATIKAIETGELADVPTVYRERAYKEADSEVESAVNKKIEETVEEQVKAAIKAQVTAAVDEQITAATASGTEITDAQRERMISSAYDTAIAENYDKAFNEAVKTAKNSDDYKKALSDAIDEAQKEIDKEIDDKYDDLAERYGLNDKFDAVPVKIYELFYKDSNETLPSDTDYSGTIRVYSERRDIDLYDILDGRPPKNDNEIIIDRMHADNAEIKIGDTLCINSIEFEVVGLAAFVDYSTLYQNNTDTMFDALTFDIGMTTDKGFERINAKTAANYAFTYTTKPADEIEEKNMSESFLKSLITQTAVSDTEELEIEDFVPAYANQAMTFAESDVGKDKVMGEVLLYILTAVLAFIFAVTISSTLEQESSVIGTLRASGYTRGELLRYYLSAPLLIVIFASIIGNILGYTIFKDVVASMYYRSYSLPGFDTLWTPEAFIRTTVVPIILMLIINIFIITKTLKLSPLRFLRHDIKKTKRKKAIRLPKWKFFSRFRVRIFLQNISNYVMLFVGITFVMLLITMAVGMPETLEHYQNSVKDMTFAEDIVILSTTEDEDGNTIETAVKDAERFSAASLERKSDSYTEEVSVYGIENSSKFVKLSKTDDDSVYISQAYADKYNVHPGDTITLSEKYDNKKYKWKVYDIYDYSAGITVFMNNEQFNRIFEKEPDDFSGYMSNTMITDIDEQYIAKEITVDDMLKVSEQLDHSMGSYMTYFQYVCFIVAAILLYLLTKIIIEKNERAISMTKILGYDNGEIASLYLIPTAVVVFLSEFLAVFIGYKLMAFFWGLIMMKMSGWFAFVLPVSGFVKEFLLVFAAYLLITIFDFIRIRKIPKVLALKNVD